MWEGGWKNLKMLHFSGIFNVWYFFSVLLSMLNKVYVKKSNDLFFSSHGFIVRITTDDFDLFYPLKPCLNILS